MSSLVQGLDKITNRNRGENGQYQENWSSESSGMEEGITNLFYQLVRVDKKNGQHKLDDLSNLYSKLVSSAVNSSGLCWYQYPSGIISPFLLELIINGAIMS